MNSTLFQYREYEQVVVEDRIEKEKARRKQEQEAIELKASIKVGFISASYKSLTIQAFSIYSLSITYNC